MANDNILSHERLRYFKWSALLMAASIGWYAVDTPRFGPGGGTVLGYTLGTVGALLIVWLLLFGIRKRQYLGGAGTVRGWLSAHVYRGAHQHVEALAVEVEHHLFQLALGHLAVRDADAGVGHERLKVAGHLLDGVDLVVQEVHLPAAGQLALEGLDDGLVLPRGDEGLHREAVRRWRGDDRQVAQAAHRHVQRARDRRGGEREQVHLGAQRLQALLLPDAEALLLVDDDEADVLELDVLLKETMSPDNHVDLALGHLLKHGLDVLGRLEARQHFDADRPVGEAVA